MENSIINDSNNAKSDEISSEALLSLLKDKKKELKIASSKLEKLEGKYVKLY